jgi:hypothetical protein
VTEDTWLKTLYPLVLLGHLGRKRRPPPTPRKLRLFACACVRRVERFLDDERLVSAITVAERYADGLAEREDMRTARRAALSSLRAARSRDNQVAKDVAWPAACAGVAAGWLAAMPRLAKDERLSSVRMAKGVAYDASQAVGYAERAGRRAVMAKDREMSYQSALLRDIFGNPFRPAALDPAWLAWNDGTVRKMAEAIYSERRWGDLSILADALEESGCSDADILGHCRGPGDDVRGCWAVDLLTGRE